MSIRPFVIAALASVAIAMALGLFLMRAEPGEYHADPSSRRRPPPIGDRPR